MITTDSEVVDALELKYWMLNDSLCRILKLSVRQAYGSRIVPIFFIGILVTVKQWQKKWSISNAEKKIKPKLH